MLLGRLGRKSIENGSSRELISCPLPEFANLPETGCGWPIGLIQLLCIRVENEGLIGWSCICLQNALRMRELEQRDNGVVSVLIPFCQNKVPELVIFPQVVLFKAFQVIIRIAGIDLE